MKEARLNKTGIALLVLETHSFLTFIIGLSLCKNKTALAHKRYILMDEAKGQPSRNLLSNGSEDG